MKIKYGIMSESECVWLVNGTFKDYINIIEYPSESPLYLTLFPLKAIYLPYTVKLLSGRVLCNNDLADSYEVGEGYFIVRFKERHNYVYSPVTPHEHKPPQGIVPRFWKSVKSGELDDARRLLTKELSDSVDDDSLIAFFAPYRDLIPNPFSDFKCSYFLINKDTAKGEPYSFEIENNLISDINEES